MIICYTSQQKPDKVMGIWRHLEASGGIWSGIWGRLGCIWRRLRGIWRHLEALECHPSPMLIGQRAKALQPHLRYMSRRTVHSELWSHLEPSGVTQSHLEPSRDMHVEASGGIWEETGLYPSPMLFGWLSNIVQPHLRCVSRKTISCGMYCHICFADARFSSDGCTVYPSVRQLSTVI